MEYIQESSKDSCTVPVDISEILEVTPAPSEERSDYETSDTPKDMLNTCKKTYDEETPDNPKEMPNTSKEISDKETPDTPKVMPNTSKQTSDKETPDTPKEMPMTPKESSDTTSKKTSDTLEKLPASHEKKSVAPKVNRKVYIISPDQLKKLGLTHLFPVPKSGLQKVSSIIDKATLETIQKVGIPSTSTNCKVKTAVSVRVQQPNVQRNTVSKPCTLNKMEAKNDSSNTHAETEMEQSGLNAEKACAQVKTGRQDSHMTSMSGKVGKSLTTSSKTNEEQVTPDKDFMKTKHIVAQMLLQALQKNKTKSDEGIATETSITHTGAECETQTDRSKETINVLSNKPVNFTKEQLLELKATSSSALDTMPVKSFIFDPVKNKLCSQEELDTNKNETSGSFTKASEDEMSSKEKTIAVSTKLSATEKFDLLNKDSTGTQRTLGKKNRFTTNFLKKTKVFWRKKKHLIPDGQETDIVDKSTSSNGEQSKTSPPVNTKSADIADDKTHSSVSSSLKENNSHHSPLLLPLASPSFEKVEKETLQPKKRPGRKKKPKEAIEVISPEELLELEVNKRKARSSIHKSSRSPEKTFKNDETDLVNFSEVADTKASKNAETADNIGIVSQSSISSKLNETRSNQLPLLFESPSPDKKVVKWNPVAKKIFRKKSQTENAVLLISNKIQEARVNKTGIDINDIDSSSKQVSESLWPNSGLTTTGSLPIVAGFPMLLSPKAECSQETPKKKRGRKNKVDSETNDIKNASEKTIRNDETRDLDDFSEVDDTKVCKNDETDNIGIKSETSISSKLDETMSNQLPLLFESPSPVKKAVKCNPVSKKIFRGDSQTDNPVLLITTKNQKAVINKRGIDINDIDINSKQVNESLLKNSGQTTTESLPVLSSSPPLSSPNNECSQESQKKKRGRKKKVDIETNEIKNDKTADTSVDAPASSPLECTTLEPSNLNECERLPPAITKRKRGRPPKKVVESPNEIVSTNLNDCDILPQTITKNKRGRPPKNTVKSMKQIVSPSKNSNEIIKELASDGKVENISANDISHLSPGKIEENIKHSVLTSSNLNTDVEKIETKKSNRKKKTPDVSLKVDIPTIATTRSRRNRKSVNYYAMINSPLEDNEDTSSLIDESEPKRRRTIQRSFEESGSLETKLSKNKYVIEETNEEKVYQLIENNNQLTNEVGNVEQETRNKSLGSETETDNFSGLAEEQIEADNSCDPLSKREHSKIIDPEVTTQNVIDRVEKLDDYGKETTGIEINSVDNFKAKLGFKLKHIIGSNVNKPMKHVATDINVCSYETLTDLVDKGNSKLIFKDSVKSEEELSAEGKVRKKSKQNDNIVISDSSENRVLGDFSKPDDNTFLEVPNVSYGTLYDYLKEDNTNIDDTSECRLLRDIPRLDHDKSVAVQNVNYDNLHKPVKDNIKIETSGRSEHRLFRDNSKPDDRKSADVPNVIYGSLYGSFKEGNTNIKTPDSSGGRLLSNIPKPDDSNSVEVPNVTYGNLYDFLKEDNTNSTIVSVEENNAPKGKLLTKIKIPDSSEGRLLSNIPKPDDSNSVEVPNVTYGDLYDFLKEDNTNSTIVSVEENNDPKGKLLEKNTKICDIIEGVKESFVTSSEGERQATSYNKLPKKKGRINKKMENKITKQHRIRTMLHKKSILKRQIAKRSNLVKSTKSLSKVNKRQENTSLRDAKKKLKEDISDLPNKTTENAIEVPKVQYTALLDFLQEESNRELNKGCNPLHELGNKSYSENNIHSSNKCNPNSGSDSDMDPYDSDSSYSDNECYENTDNDSDLDSYQPGSDNSKYKKGPALEKTEHTQDNPKQIQLLPTVNANVKMYDSGFQENAETSVVERQMEQMEPALLEKDNEIKTLEPTENISPVKETSSEKHITKKLASTSPKEKEFSKRQTRKQISETSTGDIMEVPNVQYTALLDFLKENESSQKHNEDCEGSEKLISINENEQQSRGGDKDNVVIRDSEKGNISPIIETDCEVSPTKPSIDDINKEKLHNRHTRKRKLEMLNEDTAEAAKVHYRALTDFSKKSDITDKCDDKNHHFSNKTQKKKLRKTKHINKKKSNKYSQSIGKGIECQVIEKCISPSTDSKPSNSANKILDSVEYDAEVRDQNSPANQKSKKSSPDRSTIKVSYEPVMNYLKLYCNNNGEHEMEGHTEDEVNQDSNTDNTNSTTELMTSSQGTYKFIPEEEREQCDLQTPISKKRKGSPSKTGLDNSEKPENVDIMPSEHFVTVEVTPKKRKPGRPRKIPKPYNFNVPEDKPLSDKLDTKSINVEITSKTRRSGRQRKVKKNFEFFTDEDLDDEFVEKSSSTENTPENKEIVKPKILPKSSGQSTENGSLNDTLYSEISDVETTPKGRKSGRGRKLNEKSVVCTGKDEDWDDTLGENSDDSDTPAGRRRRSWQKFKLNLERENDKLGDTVRKKRRKPGNFRTGDTMRMTNAVFEAFASHYTDIINQSAPSATNSADIDVNDDQVVCVICKQKLTQSQWSFHKMKVHNNLAWRVGDEPVDYKDQTFVMDMLIGLCRKHKFLCCFKCGITMKSVLGFLSHFGTCGRSSEELESLKVPCPQCSRMFMPVSLQPHIKQSHTLKKPGPEILEAQEDTLLGKRSAAVKALNVIQDISEHIVGKEGDADYSPQEEDDARVHGFRPVINKFYTNVLRLNDKLYVRQAFLRKLENTEEPIKCIYDTCSHKARDIQQLVSHATRCKHKPRKPSMVFLCKLCLCMSKTEEDIVIHLKSCHDEYNAFIYRTSSTLRQQLHFTDKGGKLIKYALQRKIAFLNYPKQYTNFAFPSAYKWTKEFYKKFMSEECLFEDWQCETKTWRMLNPTFLEKYLPLVSKSCDIAKMVCKKDDGNQLLQDFVFRKLDLFDSELDEGGMCTIFCGGPISAMSWAPTSHNKIADQVLAVATLQHPDDDYRLGENYSVPTMLQFWNFGHLSMTTNLTKPKLMFGMAINYGPIWHLEWCPSGCSDVNNCSDVNSNKLERLGLLAVAGSDSFVYIYAVPALKDVEMMFYKSKPVRKLSLGDCDTEIGSEAFYAVKISWSKGAGHKFLAVAYSNGIIALFNLSTNSSLTVNRNNNGTEILLPYHIFNAHGHTVTGLYLHHDEEPPRWLMTAGKDKNLFIWDLTNTVSPLHQVKKSMITEAAWVPHWASQLLGYDEGTSRGTLGCSNRSIRNILSDTATVMPSMATINSISVSDWLNCLIQGNTVGELIAVFPGSVMSFLDYKYLRKRRMIFGYTKLLEKNKTPQERDEMEKRLNSCLKEALANKLHVKKEIQTREIEEEILASSNILKSEPFYYHETEQKYALLFCDMNMGHDGKTSGTSKYLASWPYELQIARQNVYPLQSVNKIVINPNKQALSYYAAGYQAGFVRLTNMCFVKNDIDRLDSGFS